MPHGLPAPPRANLEVHLAVSFPPPNIAHNTKITSHASGPRPGGKFERGEEREGGVEGETAVPSAFHDGTEAMRRDVVGDVAERVSRGTPPASTPSRRFARFLAIALWIKAIQTQGPQRPRIVSSHKPHPVCKHQA